MCPGTIVPAIQVQLSPGGQRAGLPARVNGSSISGNEVRNSAKAVKKNSKDDPPPQATAAAAVAANVPPTCPRKQVGGTYIVGTSTSHRHSIPPPPQPPTPSPTFSSCLPSPSVLALPPPGALSAASAATSAAACSGTTGGGAASAATVACAASPIGALAVAPKPLAKMPSLRLCRSGSGGGRTQCQRRMRVIAAAWRAGSPGGSTCHEQNSNAVYGSGWEVRRAVGATAATAAAAAALDGSGGSDGVSFGGDTGGVGSGGGGTDGGTPFLEFPTAEVRMSMVSERAAATCALGPGIAERMQADCIRAVRSWCKLGYGDHIVVHVEHQQLASAPGLLSSAAVAFAGPDGRRHAAIAVSVGVLTAAGPAAVAAPPPLQPPSPSRESVSRQFAPTPADDSAAAAAATTESGPTLDLSPQRRLQRPAAAAHVAPGSSAPSLDPLPGLSLHWGCSYGPGQRWHAAAPGWHTLPAVSYDAGKGAWQTPLAVRQAIPLDLDSDLDPASGGCGGTSSSPGQWVAVYSLVLQLPWEGPIRDGGLCFVLKTARNQWIKARVLPAAGAGRTGSGHGGNSPAGGGGGVEADFWIPCSSIPVAANGVPLLPDVFRMSHSDSLPQEPNDATRNRDRARIQ
ncbi:hypothetical protein VOLCADRAFT_90210 [Volvox carteri f. nagariensis]|uniref:Uncharacterized protein n=1 Tax=Volvox carteri f. nagariensis TaxID=3068 RepID=D8TTS5_VOLCA|nr:uncharacterized protein VOLCADRAFT_90210 [Volvox carteri f. nagariensis]EFJ48914.1 hypothetical protein VOLCADRAFT_90210 [Volvox carteri f. nagariensis]|eukprot:XP_002949811.1 hypothetical protein VOLCADRAFT_90210 [Volvox carteri f. nagariensis]